MNRFSSFVCGGFKPAVPGLLVELNDFFELVRNLPGLYLDKTSQYVRTCFGFYNNRNVQRFLLQYYVRGKTTARSGQEAFYNYVKRIGTLTLGHPSSKHRAKPTISSQVFLRLGQLQGLSDGSLLPSLHGLQICTSDGSYLDHLDIFLSPSLKSLEIKEMPTDVGRSSSIMSFLDNTAEVSPDLESLILGPFELPQELLDSCVKFKQLQRLELRGVSFSTTDTILVDIGSLEHLKEFTLEERKEPPPTEPAVSEADVALPTQNPSGTTAPQVGMTLDHIYPISLGTLGSHLLF